MITSATLHNFQPSFNLVAMGSNFFWDPRVIGETMEYNLVFNVFTNRIWHWMMDSTLQDVNNFFWHSQWVKTIDCQKNTKYRFTIPMEILIVYMMYKFFHGSNFLTYNKFFVREKLIMGLIFHELLWIMNIMFRNFITWLMGQKMERWC